MDDKPLEALLGQEIGGLGRGLLPFPVPAAQILAEEESRFNAHLFINWRFQDWFAEQRASQQDMNAMDQSRLGAQRDMGAMRSQQQFTNLFQQPGTATGITAESLTKFMPPPIEEHKPQAHFFWTDLLFVAAWLACAAWCVWRAFG